MKQKIFTLLFALVASAGILRAEIYSGNCGDSVTWTLDSADSTLVIAGTGTMQNFVTYGDASWYQYRNTIKQIVIQEGVTTLGEYAFYNCNKATSVSIAESVTTIGHHALENCRALSSITIPASVAFIGYDALHWTTGLKRVEWLATQCNFSYTLAPVFSEVTTINEVIFDANVVSLPQNMMFERILPMDMYSYAINPPAVSAKTFSRLDTNTVVLHVPAQSLAVYQSAPVWKSFLHIEPIEESAQTIDDALSGEFSISVTKKIHFSKGNLQYQASTDTWRFAEHQYDFVGNTSKGNVYVDGVKCDNAYISSTYSGWVDLFGYSTTTSNYGVCASTNSSAYEGTFVDWGTLFTEEWYTLSKDEWSYLLNTRNNASDLRGVARVNGANGVILLPDNWNTPEGVTFTAGVASTYGDNSYKTINDYTAEQWAVMEQNGAVFLPAGSRRSGTAVDSYWGFGLYWTSTPRTTAKAHVFCFNGDFMRVGDEYAFYYGMNVRLVIDSNCTTALEDHTVATPATKTLRNGQLLILRDGKTYTVQGQEVK